MSNHSPENTNTPPQPPTPNQQPPQMDPGADPNNALAHLSQEELQSQWEAASERQANFERRAGKIADKLGKLSTADQVRAHAMYETAAVLNQRATTDPNSKGVSTQKIEYDEDGNVKVKHVQDKDEDGRPTGDPYPRRAIDKDVTGPHDRMKETIPSRLTTGPLSRKVAKDHSIAAGPSDPRLVRPRNANEFAPDPQALTGRQRRQLVRSASRNRKQLLRQARARDAEKIAGAGVGAYGEKAPIRTVYARHEAKADIDALYRSGNLSPVEYLRLKEAAQYTIAERPVRSVRREVARERLGGTLAMNHDEQPVRHAIRSHRMQKKMDKLHGEALGINQALDEKLAIDRERARRNGDPEWFKIGQVVPKPTTGKTPEQAALDAAIAAAPTPEEAAIPSPTVLTPEQLTHPYQMYFDSGRLHMFKRLLDNQVQREAQELAEVAGVDTLPDEDLRNLYNMRMDERLRVYLGGMPVPPQVWAALRDAANRGGRPEGDEEGQGEDQAT